MDLLHMSLTGTVMILAVIAVRAVLINRLPKITFLTLWGIAVIRLLIPVSLPSVFSIYTLLNRSRIAEEMATDTLSLPVISGVPTVFPSEAEAISNGVFSVDSIWKILWAAGALGCALFFMSAYRKCRSKFKYSPPIVHDFTEMWKESQNLRRSVEIRRTDRFSTPVTYGIIRPVILVPESMDWEDSQTAEYVLLHEYIHIRRLDGITKLILTVVVCMHWFNPLVWIMYLLANQDLELSCDESVIWSLGESKKADYARALIRMEEVKSALTPFCSSFSKSKIQERIVAIMKTKKVTKSSCIFSGALILSVAAVFSTSAFADVAQGQQQISDEDMTEKAIERLAERYPDVAEWVKDCYPDTVWWTSEGYQQMMETEREHLAGLTGQVIGSTPSTGDITVTEDLIEERMAEYEDTLAAIESGIMVSKSMDGSEEIGGSFDPADIASWTGDRALQCGILLKDGDEIVFGPYGTAEEMLAAITPFCDEQVRKGNLEKAEAEKIITRYTEMKAD